MQLKQLGLPFAVRPADIDEAPHPEETPCAIATRLASSKASHVVSLVDPNYVVIGCDQTAECNGVPLGKPGTPARAAEQLRLSAGQCVTFHSAISVHSKQLRFQETQCIETRVEFRPLTESQILDYVARELPLDCAGSFKCEGLGIALFESITSSDPTALIGLPLIALTSMLKRVGINPLN